MALARMFSLALMAWLACLAPSLGLGFAPQASRGALAGPPLVPALTEVSAGVCGNDYDYD